MTKSAYELWVATRSEEIPNLNDHFGDDTTPSHPGYAYGGGCWIATADLFGTFYTKVGISFIGNASLGECEEFLWEKWAKGEWFPGVAP